MKGLRWFSLGLVAALSLGSFACSDASTEDLVESSAQAQSQDGTSNYPSIDNDKVHTQPISMDGVWTIDGYQDRCYTRLVGWNSFASGNTIINLDPNEKPITLSVKFRVEYYRKTQKGTKIGWGPTVDYPSFEWKVIQVKYYPKSDRTEFPTWTFPTRKTRSGVSATPAKLIAYQQGTDIKYTVSFQTYFKSGENTDVIARVAPFEKKGDVKPKGLPSPEVAPVVVVDEPGDEPEIELPACTSCLCAPTTSEEDTVTLVPER